MDFPVLILAAQAAISFRLIYHLPVITQLNRPADSVVDCRPHSGQSRTATNPNDYADQAV